MSNGGLFTVQSAGEGSRTPFQDYLRLSKYASVARLMPIAKEEVAVGDQIVLFDSNGERLQYDGEEIMYVLDRKMEETGEVTFRVIPARAYSVFSDSERPPYVSIDMDKAKTRTMQVFLGDEVEGHPGMRIVNSIEYVAGYLVQLSPVRSRFFTNIDESLTECPVQILREEVKSDGSIFITAQFTEQTVWTLKSATGMGFLYYEKLD